MGFGLIYTGLIFLFNPNINIIDVLPDFIGYALILFGLYRLRDLAPALADSMRSFFRLFICTLLKAAITFIIPQLPDQGYLLVFAFCFTLAEVAFLFPAFTHFFDGMFFVGTVYNGDYSIKYLNKAKKTTMLFVVIKGVLTLLPEFVYLYVNEDLGYILAEYKGLLNILCAVTVFITGIVWLIIMHRFYKFIVSDDKFIKNMTTYYLEYIKPNRNLFLRRCMKYAFTLFIIGFIFLTDIYIDGIDYLPDALGLLLIISGLFIAKKYNQFYKLPITLCGISLLVSAFGWIYVKTFSDRYFVYGIAKSMEAYRMYIMTIVISVAEAAVLIVLLVVLNRYFLKIISEHTGHETESTLPSVIAKEESQKKSLRIKSYSFMITGFITALSGVAYTIYLYIRPAYWMINTAVSIIWLILCSKLISDLSDEIERKYM